ncbi:ribonuclease [Xylella taiwanensis]|uniref:Ribonuclease n=1 Tax=Xylella taiwanensis TaxID=1444770 RepID=Z9JIR8_9GAMM|nr:ribonuclease domain-containing protein [Xylella taiwanensis]AXI84301.1 ribonuclease [Xylella taiwanensis]EWS77731.1 ribonuclease [Xylella taiwanensis]MCD8457418.1 ribonuclease [Xylella taiwanensis]MCD8457576.1 ribonuclease [Xylella taiwanensis]MCD8461300.1 ribonuclease [Xylella taiwanensis]
MRRTFTLSVTVLLLVATLWSMRALHTPKTEFALVPQHPHGTAHPPSLRTTDELPEFLPAEARAIVTLIQQGGPFSYHKDGSIFGNRERLLPARPYGYYHEYTVETPGSPDRGARRIVTGGDPPEIWYYSDDHYASFRSFKIATP